MRGHLLTREPSAVIFDGDDTLWFTEPLYDQARNAARQIVTDSGVDGATWERLQRQIDLNNVAKMAYSPDRFPTSCVQAYEQLRRQQGLEVDVIVASRIEKAARQTFEWDAELAPDVHLVLAELRNRGIHLALLTKGDPGVQHRRISRSGLAGYFELIRVVSDKSVSDIRKVVDELRVRPENTWLVGNSMRSDVLPALEAGIRAIWIDAHVWEHERTHDHLVDSRVRVVESLSEIPATLATAKSELPTSGPQH